MHFSAVIINFYHYWNITVGVEFENRTFWLGAPNSLKITVGSSARKHLTFIGPSPHVSWYSLYNPLFNDIQIFVIPPKYMGQYIVSQMILYYNN